MYDAYCSTCGWAGDTDGHADTCPECDGRLIIPELDAVEQVEVQDAL